MKLLIIEDEKDLSDALVRGFKKMGYYLDTAFDGKDGYELYLLNDYDVIVLDLNLPSMDGMDVLKSIRNKDPYQRVIILSARTSLEWRLEGLDTGANDYLCKPFDFLELEARIRNLLRRKILQQESEIKIKKIQLDTRIKKVTTCEDQVIDLAPKEYQIFEYLVLNPNQIISAETLIDHVWGDEVNLFTDSVKVHISNLRKKLREATGEEYVITIRGFGYKISYEVTDDETK